MGGAEHGRREVRAHPTPGWGPSSASLSSHPSPAPPLGHLRGLPGRVAPSVPAAAAPRPCCLAGQRAALRRPPAYPSLVRLSPTIQLFRPSRAALHPRGGAHFRRQCGHTSLTLFQGGTFCSQ